MANTWLRCLALAVFSAGLTGCFLWTSRGEGDRLTEEGAARQQRIEALESGIAEEREQLTAQVARSREQVAELEQVLNQATQVVTRNSADLGQEVRSLREQVQTLEGQLAELRNAYRQAQAEHLAFRSRTDQQLNVLSQKAGLDVALSPEEIPAGADGHFPGGDASFQCQPTLAFEGALSRIYRAPQR